MDKPAMKRHLSKVGLHDVEDIAPSLGGMVLTRANGETVTVPHPRRGKFDEATLEHWAGQVKARV